MQSRSRGAARREQVSQSEMRILGGALSALGLAFAGAGAATSQMALAHMNAIGALCGPGVAHCIWCPVSVGLIAAAGVAGLAGVKLLRRAIPATA
jgi:hypothetical protein